MMDPKILLVDDEGNARNIIKKHLNNNGYYEIVEAVNGKEALSKLSKDKIGIKLIILDIMMPVMDGKTFLNKAREDGFMAPVIITTSVSLEELSDLDVFEMFNKPIDFDRFSEAVGIAMELGINRAEVIHRMRGLSRKLQETIDTYSQRAEIHA